jgi:hypothetical protein
MSDATDELRELLLSTPDDGLGNQEWDVLNRVLDRHPDRATDLFAWMLTEHKGYVAPRVQAGQELRKIDPVQLRSALERLIQSGDPDDRSTAVLLLKESRDSQIFAFAKPLLRDPYPYLQFEAVELLKDVYPNDVRVTLRGLLDHEEKWAREEAQKLLTDWAITAE